MRIPWRRAVVNRIEFCDRCDQVCTAQCRAEARLERTRATVYTLVPLR